MNNPRFYIYGVPDGFNMLSGTPEEILYYQLFYDTSKKGREMRINRKANGETVYSYLIYNLVACKGREGAFLGMSIAFNGNEYCNNPVALKELFEGVYNEVILKADDKEKIITAIDGGNAVGRFCITKFEERKEMCEKIGRIFINNVVGELASSIRTIDTGFDNSKEGRILTLPLDADNINVSRALRSYSWVSLSSECKSIPVSAQDCISQKQSDKSGTAPITINQDLLSVHFIDELTKKVGSYKDFIIKGLKGLASMPDITTKREEINHYLDTIEEYVGRQPELGKLKSDYMSIYKELINLRPQQPNPGPTTYPPVKEKRDGLMKLVQPHLTKIAVSLCAMLVIGVIVFLWPSDDSKPTPTDTTDAKEIADRKSGLDEASEVFDENGFKTHLDSADYIVAWKMLQIVGDTVKRRSFEMALQNSYRVWFNDELEKCKDDLQGLIKLKKKIAAYAEFNEDNNRHNDLLAYYINPLQERVSQLERERQERLAQQQREQQEKLAREGEKRKNEGEGSSADGSTHGRSSGSVIMIFKASGDYKKGEQISASDGYVIRCKRHDCFVVEGATLSSKDNDIEASPTNGTIRIRVPKVGEFKVKLNQVVYTFQVKSS